MFRLSWRNRYVGSGGVQCRHGFIVNFELKFKTSWDEGYAFVGLLLEFK